MKNHMKSEKKNQIVWMWKKTYLATLGRLWTLWGVTLFSPIKSYVEEGENSLKHISRNMNDIRHTQLYF